MKFSTFNLLTLLSVGSALTLKLESTIAYKSIQNALFASSQLYEGDTSVQNDDQVIDTVTQLQCQTNIKNLNCISQETDVTKINYDEICKPLNDKKCIDFFNKGLSELEGCKSYPKDQLEFSNKVVKFEYATLKFLCEKDEQGKDCPLSTLVKDVSQSMDTNEMIIDEQDEQEMAKLLDDTCKSKRCTENTVNFYDEYFEFVKAYSEQLGQDLDTEIDKEKAEINQVLLSDKCVKAQVLTSDASSTVKKLGNIMLITIGLLLYIL
ncbi:hypothetical protein BCR32DRAFT_329837, partial [Anaeromyces robustus]